MKDKCRLLHDLDILLNMPCLFGLESQGHIPTIEKMLAENKTWDEIGKTIGWHSPTAQEHYERYLKKKRVNMLKRLAEVMRILPSLLNDKSKWDSLIINRRKPYTYRVHTQLDDVRVCLHKFERCDEHESFFHPHPWPGAFIVLSGGYRMGVGYSQSRIEKPDHVMNINLTKWCSYEITEAMTWHSVIPHGLTYSVMVNGPPWEGRAHQDVRTTKGKDLEKMSDADLEEHLRAFNFLVDEYNRMPHRGLD